MRIYFYFLLFCLAAELKALPPFFRILDQTVDCNHMVKMDLLETNCSDVNEVPHGEAPAGPLWGSEQIKAQMDNHWLVPVLTVVWEIQADGSHKELKGSKLVIVDENSNQSLCVQLSYSLNSSLNPKHRQWSFSLDAVVEPWHTYSVTVFNLPQPQTDTLKMKRIEKQITVPGCGDTRMQWVQLCLENGSRWDPRISAVFADRKSSVLVTFHTDQYSERYHVLIQNDGLNCSKTVSKQNATSLNVTFENGLCQLSECDVLVMIRPFFRLCNNNLSMFGHQGHKNISKHSNVCLTINAFNNLLGPLLTSPAADEKQTEVFQVQGRKRVLIIYSLDHPLYKNVVLKFSSFLSAKCGTEVVLDLLDSTGLGVLGGIQWLDWHKKQIENSSDKILILCSRGVQAKWRAMCGDKQVYLREDVSSPIGDMLTPSLSLLVPHFIHSQSFEKYIVAYFDGISSEEDIPSPFNIMVRYKLMKQFEEVFFRILNTEKHEPGRVKLINGLSEDGYHQCPSGWALQDAIEAFSAYQRDHPRWFDDELLENSDVEEDETYCIDPKTFKNHLIYFALDSTHVVGHVEAK
uniref:SEFIR domain-containing protein n=1 Tax=Nothobranchius furzeri TaxID=105023 RepID=A0A8C6PS87_NOTFU